MHHNGLYFRHIADDKPDGQAEIFQNGLLQLKRQLLVGLNFTGKNDVSGVNVRRYMAHTSLLKSFLELLHINLVFAAHYI